MSKQKIAAFTNGTFGKTFNLAAAAAAVMTMMTFVAAPPLKMSTS